MGKKLCVLVITTGMAVFGVLARAADASHEIVERAETGIVLIVDPSGSSGTASLIHRDGYLLSANHVVTGEHVLAFFLRHDSNGDTIADIEWYIANHKELIQRKQCFWATVVRRAALQDLVLLKIASVPASARRIPIASNVARRGETIHIIGNPNGEVGTYEKGHVRARLAIDEMFQVSSSEEKQRTAAQILRIGGVVYGGNSGSPAINDKGELVGVIFATTDYGTSDTIANAIDLTAIRQFLWGRQTVHKVGGHMQVELIHNVYDHRGVKGMLVRTFLPRSIAGGAALVDFNCRRCGGDLATRVWTRLRGGETAVELFVAYGSLHRFRGQHELVANVHLVDAYGTQIAVVNRGFSLNMP